MILTSPSSTIVIPKDFRAFEPVFIQAKPGQRIVSEPGARIEINSDVRGIDGGHPLQISGLRGSEPRTCRVDLKLTSLEIIVGPKGRIFDDAISLISVQGSKTMLMGIHLCSISGNLRAGDESDTAICLDRNTDWFDVWNNKIDIYSGNSAIVSAGGGRGYISSNRIAGRSYAKSQDRSAIAAYLAYKRDGMKGVVEIASNEIVWGGGPEVWNDTIRAYKAQKKAGKKRKERAS